MADKNVEYCYVIVERGMEIFYTQTHIDAHIRANISHGKTCKHSSDLFIPLQLVLWWRTIFCTITKTTQNNFSGKNSTAMASGMLASTYNKIAYSTAANVKHSKSNVYFIMHGKT